MSISRFTRLLAAVLFAAGSTVAGAAEPELEIEVSPSSVRVGDRVEVVVAARGGGDLLWGELTITSPADGPWALADRPTAVPGARPPVWRMLLAPLEIGELELPAISVSARAADGEAVAVGASEAPTVNVVSVLSGDEGDTAPAPLRDPIGVRGPPWEWILPVCCLALPLLAGVAWWWRGRSAGSADLRPALPPLAELEVVVSDLEARVGREPADGICDRLAAALRRFLERRTGEPAAEMTSFELRLLARRRGWPETIQRLVQDVMAVADGVRFGRRPTSDENLRRAIGCTLEAARAVETFLQPPEEDQRVVEASG